MDNPFSGADTIDSADDFVPTAADYAGFEDDFPTHAEFADRGLCYSCGNPVNECVCLDPSPEPAGGNVVALNAHWVEGWDGICNSCGYDWSVCPCDAEDSEDDSEDSDDEDDGQPSLYEEYDGLHGNYYYMEMYDTEY